MLQKITVNVPRDLIQSALALTGKSLTQTIIDGLKELERANKLRALKGLRGKIHFDLDLAATRK